MAHAPVTGVPQLARWWLASPPQWHLRAPVNATRRLDSRRLALRSAAAADVPRQPPGHLALGLAPGLESGLAPGLESVQEELVQGPGADLVQLRARAEGRQHQ